jgi:hypothetical protein
LRILVLVLGARVAPYRTLMRAIRRTWASDEVPDVETLFYCGGSALRVDGDRLALPVADDLSNVGHKTLACFEHVLGDRRFDLIFRTNCSSYVDLPNLRDFALDRGRDSGFYCGVVRSHDGVSFASGSGYFLSRDLVELVVERQSAWDHTVLDDVALGSLLGHSSVHPEPAPRRDYYNLAELTEVDTSQFHFRCKTDSWRRLEDVRMMLELQRAFRLARGLPSSKEETALRALGWVGGQTARLVARAKEGR